MCALLVVDAGNSNIHFGVFASEHLAHRFRIASRTERTVDELDMLIHAMLGGANLAPEGIDGVILSCVVPPLAPLLGELFRERFGLTPLTVGPGIRTGLAIGADNPREIGADRIVNLVGAMERHGLPAIVVDLGTATTFSVVDADKRYLGGAIAPGLRTAVDALVRQTARLPHIELAAPKQVIGRNTSDSIQAGALFGFAGLVDGMVERIRRELGATYPVIATGGLAALVAPLCNIDMICDADLTLYGLHSIFRRNRIQ